MVAAQLHSSSIHYLDIICAENISLTTHLNYIGAPCNCIHIFVLIFKSSFSNIFQSSSLLCKAHFLYIKIFSTSPYRSGDHKQMWVCVPCMHTNNLYLFCRTCNWRFQILCSSIPVTVLDISFLLCSYYHLQIWLIIGQINLWYDLT